MIESDPTEATNNISFKRAHDIMKQIPLSEAAARLSEYGQMCRQERVIIVENGQPAFELSPLEDDAFMSDLIENNADFRAELGKRKSGKFVSADEALKRLTD